MSKYNLLKSMILTAIMLHVFSAMSYCESNYEKGQVYIAFKADVSEEDAVKFVKGLNLQIVKKDNFIFPFIHFNIEGNEDVFIKDIKREPTVSSATKGEKLRLNDKEGTVVRVKFIEGASRKQKEDLSLSYRNRKEIIAWRYYRSGVPFMIVKVPVGKEQEWMKTINKPEYKNIVENVSLISFDLPS